ncbi:MAG: transglutaminase domain-containing protein [Candidatus Jordarchaeaceae archaeon]
MGSKFTVFSAGELENLLIQILYSYQTRVEITFVGGASFSSRVSNLLSNVLNNFVRSYNEEIILRSYSYSTSVDSNDLKIFLSINYWLSIDQIEYLERFVENNIYYITKGSSKEVEIAFHINQWLKDNVKYDKSKKCRTDYDAIRYGKTVCTGYSLLFNRLAKAAGLDCRVVRGNAKLFGGHAWNQIKIGGEWYFVDCTWNAEMDINKYFLISLYDLERTHKLDSKYERPLADVSYAAKLIERIESFDDENAFDELYKLYKVYYIPSIKSLNKLLELSLQRGLRKVSVVVPEDVHKYIFGDDQYDVEDNDYFVSSHKQYYVYYTMRL